MAARKFSFLRNEGATQGGGRFWQSLCDEWERHPDYDPKNYSEIFFNISGPIRCFIANWVRGKKIFVRVDGIYHEKITRQALESSPHLLIRWFVGFLFSLFGERDWISELFNLFPRNVGILLKIAMSSGVIYQSEFSRKMYSRYFPRKKSIVVANAYPWSLSDEEFSQRLNNPPPNGAPLRLVTTYDFFRTSKRLGELIDFVVFCNEVKRRPVHLTILGYREDRQPRNLSEDNRAQIKSGRYVSTIPAFKKIEGAVRDSLLSQHLYATFTFRDNCPNAVIEAMSFALPVFAQSSGGLPDIVGTAGALLPANANVAHFSSFDYSYDYPPLDFEAGFRALGELQRNYPAFVQRVHGRFEKALNLQSAAARYLTARELV